MWTRRSAEAAIALFALSICALTLGPVSAPGSAPTGVLRLSLPSPADLLRNVVLFAPLGAALGLRGVALRRVLWATLAFSAALEIIQSWLPGRYVSPWDIAADVSGAALGAWTVRVLVLPAVGSAERAARLGVRGGIASGLVMLAAAALSNPSFTEGRYFAHWVPDLPHFGAYAGTLQRATLNGRPVRHGPLSHDLEIREQLRGPFTLSVRLNAAPGPDALAALFMLTDSKSREILLLGVDGSDVVVHSRDLGAALGLEIQPFRLDDALIEVAPGDELDIELRRHRDRFELWIDGRSVTSFQATLGGSWALIAPRWRLPSTSRTALGTALMSVLWLAPGLAFGARRRAFPLALGLAALMLALPAVTAVAASPLSEWLGGVAGFGVGTALGHQVARRETQRASPKRPPR